MRLTFNTDSWQYPLEIQLVILDLQETGMVCMQEPTTEFQLESPGGLIKVQALCSDGQVDQVVLDSMPSFVFYTDKKV